MSEYKPLFDFLKSEKKLDEPQAMADTRTVSNERAMLAGATPLLVGLLTGNTGDAIDVAAGGLIAEDKRAQEEQSSLMDYLKKKQVANAKAKSSDRLYQVRDRETGDIRYVTADEARGSLAPHRRRPEEESVRMAGSTTEAKEKVQKRFGKGYEIKTDEEGRLKKIYKGEEDISPSDVFPQKDDSSITPKFKERVDKRYGKLSSRVKEDIDSIRTAERGLSLANSKGIMPRMVALNMAVKVTEARATDEDYNRVIKHVSRIQRLREEIEEEKNAEISKRKIKEANELFESILSVAKNSLKREVESSARSISDTDAQYELAIKRFSDLLPKYKQKASVSIGPISADKIQNISDEEIEARIDQLKNQGKNNGKRKGF